MKRRFGLIEFLKASNPTLVVALEMMFGVVVNLLSLAIFFYISQEVLEKTTLAWDVRIAMFIYALRTPLLTQLMLLFSFLGSGVTLAVATLISIVMLMRKHRKEATLFAVTLIIGVLLDVQLKALIARPRPSLAPLVIESNYSFPSGHAMNAFIFYTLLAYFSHHFSKSKKWSRVVIVFSILMISIIGLSRVYLGVHYPSDVLAGYIAGFWWFVTAILIEQTFIFLHIFKKSE